MNKSYKIFYYLAFLLTGLLCFIAINKGSEEPNLILMIMSAVTFLTALIFTIIHRKNKIEKKEIIFPIIYLIFIIIIAICAYIYNINAMIPYIHFTYYASLMLIAYVGLNVYTLLLFIRKQK